MLKKFIKNTLCVLFYIPILLIPSVVIVGLVTAYLRLASWILSPINALKILLPLKRDVESLIGVTASKYGLGIHPKFEITKYHDFFIEQLDASCTVLDIGCGEGYLSYLLAHNCDSISAVEIEKSKYLKAIKRYKHKNLKFYLGDGTLIQFPEKFNRIVLSNVLEHIEDRVAFLVRLKEMCSKDAKFLIRVPAIERDWTIVFAKNLKLPWKSDDTHYIEHTNKELQEELVFAGLEVAEIKNRWGEILCVAKLSSNFVESSYE